MLRSESALWNAGFTKDWWKGLAPEDRATVLDTWSDAEVEAFAKEWRIWAGEHQLAPSDPNWTLWVLLMGRGSGKALALDTAIPTPTGWTTMGEIQTGDRVFDETGAICNVVKAHDVLLGRECYRVRFSDGSEIVADAEHLWLTETRRSRKAEGRRRPGTGTKGRMPQIWPAVRTTQEIADTLIDKGERNHSVPVTQALRTPNATLPIDPYLFGVWLGDGSSKMGEITSADPEVIEEFVRAGEPVGKPRPAGGRSMTYPITNGYVGSVEGRKKTFTGRLRALGVLGNKHIPDVYLRASPGQRLALLQGLMDTDGYAGGSSAEFCSMKEDLAKGVFELVTSLGMIPTHRTGEAALDGVVCGTKHRICFRPRAEIFRLKRKRATVKPLGGQARRTGRRFIVSVDPVESVPVRCITVDSESHLYLAGRSMIPTHNTRTAVETVRDLVTAGKIGRICLLGQGADDVRDVMIEGESGVLATATSWFRPTWQPSRGVLEWPNGAIAHVYSAEDPEALRGPQFDFAWIDEIMAFKAEARAKAESNLRFGLRLGPRPRRMYTTTPIPHKWIRDLVKKIEAQERLPDGRMSKGMYISRGSTYLNAENLPDSFLESLKEDYEGTRLGKQELFGEILGDTEGALWQTSVLDANRVLNGVDTTEEQIQAFAKTMERVVVAVDPNMKAGGASHAAGITVHGIRGDTRYLLADRSIRGASPAVWGAQVVKAADDYEAEEIVAEVNQGGDLVKTVIYQVAGNMGVPIPSVRNVHASRGKQRRAEPVAAAYEQGKVKHVGPASRYESLETQLCELHEGHDPTGEDFDRADSVVWGQTRLARKGRSASSSDVGPGILTMSAFGG